MKRLSLLKAALPLALVCGPLLSQDVIEIHGYTRAGVGRSSNGKICHDNFYTYHF